MVFLPKALSTLGFALVLSFFVNHANGLNIAYCSLENTGSSFQAVYQQFQSNGACQQTCQDNYALAVLQGANCWCTNYAPADTVDNSNCNQQCPGYFDSCGNKNKGLYGYYPLTKAISGTVGSSSPTAAPSTSTSSSEAPSSSPTSSQYSPPPPSATPTPTSSSPTPSASTSISSTLSSSTISQQASTTTELPSPFTSVVTQTQEGKTIFSTTVVTPTAAPVSNKPPKAESGVSHGAVAGIVVGVIAALAGVAGLLIAYYRKRLKEERRKSQYQDDSGSFGPTSEKYSPMESEGHRWDPTFGIGFMPGRKSQRSSTHLKTTTSRRSTNADTSASPVDRQSMTFVDSRLNPHSFGIHEAGRVSAQSLADHQDYSRPLRVTNGDDPQ